MDKQSSHSKEMIFKELRLCTMVEHAAGPESLIILTINYDFEIISPV